MKIVKWKYKIALNIITTIENGCFLTFHKRLGLPFGENAHKFQICPISLQKLPIPLLIYSLAKMCVCLCICICLHAHMYPHCTLRLELVKIYSSLFYFVYIISIIIYSVYLCTYLYDFIFIFF